MGGRKYSKEALKRMANQLLSAKAAGDQRYTEFILIVSFKAQSAPSHVERMIRAYAAGRA